MKDHGDFPDSLMLKSQSAGVVRLTDKGTLEGVGGRRHSLVEVSGQKEAWHSPKRVT